MLATEDDISLSPSKSLEPEQSVSLQCESEYRMKQNNKHPQAKKPVAASPPSAGGDQSFQKLQIVRRLFAKKKYETLERDAKEIQKAQSPPGETI